LRLWHSSSVGSYHCAMRAQPAEQHLEDPLDPQWILRELPGQERANFLAAYREALDGARDPAGWGHLRRVLRLWSRVVIVANRPGFYEAQEAALAAGCSWRITSCCAVPRRELPAVPGAQRAPADRRLSRVGVRHARDAAGQDLRRPVRPGVQRATGVSRRRVADVGDFGFIVFAVDEAADLVRVFDLVWTG